MNKRIKIKETDLDERALCPLRLVQIGSTQTFDAPVDEVQTVIDNTFGWAVRTCFEHGLPALEQIRKQFDQQCKGKKDPQLVLMGARVSRRISDFILRYEIVQPDIPYVLTYEGVEIEGSYAVVTETNKQDRLMVCRPVTKIRAELPPPSSLAKWLHLRHQEPAALVKMLLYDVTNDRSKEFLYQEKYVRSFLSGILTNIAQKRLYPTPGEHCETCPSKSCEGVFDSWTG